MTDGRFMGHAGYGGQFLLVDTETKTSISFLSVLENEDGYDDVYMGDVAATLKNLLEEFWNFQFCSDLLLQWKLIFIKSDEAARALH